MEHLEYIRRGDFSNHPGFAALRADPDHPDWKRIMDAVRAAYECPKCRLKMDGFAADRAYRKEFAEWATRVESTIAD